MKTSDVPIKLIKINNHIELEDGNKYISLDMPSHRKCLERIGFKKYSNYGWRVWNNHLNEINTKQLKKE